MNFSLLLSLIVVAAAMATPLNPEISAASFQWNIAPPVTYDPLEVHGSPEFRQQLPSVIFGLLFIKYFKFMVSIQCLLPSAFPICIEGFLSSTKLIFTLISCVVSPTTCPCPNFPISCSLPLNRGTTYIHMNDTHVENIRAATQMAMSNPSDLNVDVLLNLMIDLIATNTNTSSVHDQPVQKNHFMLPLAKDRPFVSAKSTTTTNQDNIDFKTDTDGPLIPAYLPFPIHTIVPYSHFQWPMYPELLRPQPVFL